MLAFVIALLNRGQSTGATFASIEGGYDGPLLVVPPSLPCMRWNVRVAKAHSASASPPTPIGFSRLCCGAAPNPSMETNGSAHHIAEAYV